MRNTSFPMSILCVVLLAASCIIDGGSPTNEGGTGGRGGSPGSGGASSSGGTKASGGVKGSGGVKASGGSSASGGKGAGSGGSQAAGGAKASGGVTSSGGSANGGSGGRAGSGAGGAVPTGGTTAAGGRIGRGTGGVTFPGSGGRTSLGSGGTSTGGGGSTSTGTSTSVVDCNATMPSGGVDHCGQNSQGKASGDLMWSLWSNAINSNGCITTFSTPAFSARWNNNNDFLARVGLEFGNAGKTYDQYGTLKADFSFKKSGSGGGYSYIGIYGWTNDPCVEWYIVDDRFSSMPFNAYNAAQKGTATIDGESYKLFQNRTNGTGGSRCTGINEWDQFWSIRQKARQCGTITISEHFKAWEAAGLKMGGLLEAKILVETGGGQGSIEFPVANVTAQ